MITIDSGDDCRQLQCIFALDFFQCTDGSLGSVTAWNADINTQYRVLLEGAGDQIEYYLEVGTIDGPINDICRKALPLEIGDRVEGNTRFGDYDFTARPGSCGSSLANFSPG